MTRIPMLLILAINPFFPALIYVFPFFRVLQLQNGTRNKAIVYCNVADGMDLFWA